VFHCIIFPAMLKAEGSYILPENVPANEFLNLEGDKISTSRNWAVWLHEYLEDFPGKQDVLRYVLTANAPETKDNDFTWKDFQARNNNELVAILGNFVNRALVLTQKYYNGIVPQRGELTEYDVQTLNDLASAKEKIEKSLDSFRIREALFEAMNIARIGNKYLADTEPWSLQKTNPERVKTIMNISLQITANCTIGLAPFLPNSCQRMLEFLNCNSFVWSDLGCPNLIAAGHEIGKSELLFEKIEDEVIEKQVQKLLDTKAANSLAEATPEPAKENIVYDEFSRMDIRTATIVEAERVPKTDKLMKLKVDTGLDVRTVVSGIAAHFSADELPGKQVLILANLAPRKIKGIESQGMILLAEDANGKLVFVTPTEVMKNGCVVR
jgi:methionyl-tRNA synthetase